MASVIDELMARDGQLDPDLVGIHQARAADFDWLRERGESERAFIARVRREATAAGIRVVHVCGALQVTNIIGLRRQAPPGGA
jgi:hypothetical protein